MICNAFVCLLVTVNQGLVEKRQKQIDEFREFRKTKLKEFEERKAKFIECKYINNNALTFKKLSLLRYMQFQKVSAVNGWSMMQRGSIKAESQQTHICNGDGCRPIVKLMLMYNKGESYNKM